MKLFRSRGILGQTGMPLLTHASQQLRTELIKSLTFPNPAYEQTVKFSPWGANTKIPETICLAIDDFDGLRLPRGFSDAELSESARKELKATVWADNRQERPAKFPSLRHKPNSSQESAVERTKEALALNERPFGNFCYIMPTSEGKSFTQLMCAKELGQKTLIICLTNLIKKAWYDEIEKLFGLHRSKIGLIQQKTFRIGECVTIAMAATLGRKKNIWPDIFAEFGTVVLDEVDVVASPNLLKFFQECSCKYVLGATATSSGDYGKENYQLKNQFGPPILRINKGQNSTKTANMMGVAAVKEINTPTEYFFEYGALDFNNLLEEISLCDRRNQLICKEVLEDWKNGHSVLVVTHLVAHAYLLFEMLKDDIEDANLLIGGQNATKNEILVESVLNRNVRCIISTEQAVMRGANMNPLDRLHFASPIKKHRTIEQIIGRMRRVAPGKESVHLRYYKDICVPYLHSMYKKSAFAVFKRLQIPPYDRMFIT